MLGESVLAAKEKTGSRNDAFPHAKTRVWGLPLDNQNGIGGSSPVTSTSIWRWGHVYAGTASSALDNRYYSNAYGRFMTPDPYPKSGKSQSPQSWNRYAYVNGDPANGADPTGLYLPLPLASSGDGEDWDYGGAGASNGGLLGEDGDSGSDPSWGVLWSVWVQLGGVGDGGGTGGGGNGESGASGVAANNFAEAEDASDAYNDLAKSNCYALLGFSTAKAAQTWFKTINFYEGNYGRLVIKGGVPAGPPTPAVASTNQQGDIYLNQDYNWADFSKDTTSTGATLQLSRLV